jgi:hypothetical protein
MHSHAPAHLTNPPPPLRYITDGEKRLRDLKDAIDHETKTKAALDKAKADAAAGELCAG